MWGLAKMPLRPAARSFILDADASHYYDRAVLSQQQQDRTKQVIAYSSLPWMKMKKTIAPLDWKCLLWSSPYTDYFRNYLSGLKFCLQTDNHLLQWLIFFKEPPGHAGSMFAGMPSIIWLWDPTPARKAKYINIAMQTVNILRRNHRKCPFSVPPVTPQVWC